jgi:pimeloyl-ACP methyl ester carboxylesterase
LFCATAAVSAAAFADPLVEAASNGGFFGRGNFTDRSNLDVAPALLTSIALAFLYAVLRARPIVTPASLAFARSLRETLRAGSGQSLRPFLPAIFGLELVVLFVMETLEQIVVFGHPLGGSIWLGGPIATALALHAAACIATAILLRMALDALTRTVVAIALFVRAANVFRETRDFRGSRLAALEPHARARMHPLASRCGKRAPPLLLT